MNKITTLKLVKFYCWTGLAFFLINVLLESFAYSDTMLERAVNTLILTSYLTVLNYVFFEVAIPLFKGASKRILAALLLTFALLLLFSFGLYEWRRLWMNLHVYTGLVKFESYLENVAVHSQFSIATIVFFGIIRNFYNYAQLERKAKQLQIEKQQAELNYLKSQTNPHFLFNTLNNIYALAREKSDKAPQSILQLSKILRFMLYETSGKYIGVEQEIAIIQDYIALEKLRYDDSLTVTFKYELDDSKQPLPPLLMIPLVENAFKHGASETRCTPFIDINLEIKKNHLSFLVKNSTDINQEEKVMQENIGLSNLRRQLELLYTDYTLSASKNATLFTATLHINLESHA